MACAARGAVPSSDPALGGRSEPWDSLTAFYGDFSLFNRGDLSRYTNALDSTVGDAFTARYAAMSQEELHALRELRFARLMQCACDSRGAEQR
jgi:hypothetical protein